MQSFPQLVFSGVQPTGNLHLGNYLGAMVNWIRMAETHESIYCVVDMHAITVWQDPRELNKAIRDVTADGRDIYVYTPNDPKAVYAQWRWGLDGVISDDPQKFL